MTKSKFNTKQLVLAALCVALGVVLPVGPQHPQCRQRAAARTIPCCCAARLAGLQFAVRYSLPASSMIAACRRWLICPACCASWPAYPCGGRAAPVRAHGKAAGPVHPLERHAHRPPYMA
ncbi:MAG: hypothetical protein ACLR7U_02085 [Ruthenibacterium lactatiformans]